MNTITAHRSATYELEVNKCIPAADKYATYHVPNWKRDENTREEWDRVFHARMDQVLCDKGIRVSHEVFCALVEQGKETHEGIGD